MPTSRDRRNDAPLIQATPGAIAILAITTLLAIVFGFWSLHELGTQLGEIGGGVSEIVSSLKESATTPATPTPAPAADVAAPAPPPPPDRPADAFGQLRYAVDRCMPSLPGLVGEARVIGIDMSAAGVDVVQESAVAGRFVRFSCEWNGTSFNLIDSGRMVLPPAVGDPAKLPARPIDIENLTGSTIAALADRAADLAGVQAAHVRRVEIAYTVPSREMIRFSFDNARALVIDPEAQRMQGVFFPRVERYREFADHDAAEAAKLEGFRDTGEWNWSQGVAGSVGEIAKYFEPSARFAALELTRPQVKATQPARAGVTEVLIDIYGDLGTPAPAERFPQHCAKPFALGEARAALDAAIRARGESAAQFEEHQFEFAIFDCLDNPKRAAWRFQ